MIKKFMVFMILVVIMTTLTSCGTKEGASKNDEEKESLINIVGVFYGDCGSDEGRKDLYVVFDYKNDKVNREMPEDVSEVTVTFNEVNTYEAMPNEMHSYYHNASYDITDYGWFERYTGYRYVIGFGELLGGAESVRMFAHFSFNPNDMNDAESIKLTVQDQSDEFGVAQMKEVSVIDEILQVEKDYEKAVIMASGKWRLDTVFRSVTFIAGIAAPYGDTLAHIKVGMNNLFSETISGNVSVYDEPVYSLSKQNESYFYGKYNEGLPLYNEKMFLEAYPDEAANITKIIKEYSELADIIATPNGSFDRAEELVNSIRNTYAEVCDAWEVEVAPE